MVSAAHLTTLVSGAAAHFTALRHTLHRQPELAYNEHHTAAHVADALRRSGLDDVQEGWAKTGVIGVLHGARPGPVVALRADMDALPIHEENTTPHASQVPGKMHACGHDGHTAMLLTAAAVLAQLRSALTGTVVLIFQPAEEGQGGARLMVEEGILDRFCINAIFGLHNWPGLPAGTIAVHPGPVMAGDNHFDITLRGKGSHAAMPHLGQDPLLAGCALVQALQTIVSRNIDPLAAAVLSITRFNAGHAYNVIPGEAHLAGTLRTFDDALRAHIQTRMAALCEQLPAGFGATATLTWSEGYPPTLNHPDAAAFCADTARATVGEEAVRWSPPPSMGAEDFAFYLHARPGCYIWLGNGETSPALHHPRYDFNDAILPIGATYWVRLALGFAHWFAQQQA